MRYFFINKFCKCKTSPLFLFAAYCLLLTAFLFIGCAPKIIKPAPPQYIEELSLKEVIAKAGGDIETLKVIAEIRIKKNNEFYDQVDASLLIKKPDWLHIRIYKFGMLVRDIVMKDGRMHFLTGKSDERLGWIANEFFHSIFWWDGLEGGSMKSSGEEYIIKTENKEIHVDRTTLLPLRQDIDLFTKVIHVKYAGPKDFGGFWYPSELEITVDKFKLIMKIDKMLKNPMLGEFDFKTREKG